MILTREDQRTGKKPVTVPLRPPQISHKLKDSCPDPIKAQLWQLHENTEEIHGNPQSGKVRNVLNEVHGAKYFFRS
jgi:hypothetical protein